MVGWLASCGARHNTFQVPERDRSDGKSLGSQNYLLAVAKGKPVRKPASDRRGKSREMDDWEKNQHDRGAPSSKATPGETSNC